MIASYDLDGVINLGPNFPGLNPGKNDVIITGRSYEEKPETLAYLEKREIKNEVFFNHIPFTEKTREKSGLFKAKMLNTLLNKGYDIRVHFENDPVQIKIIRDLCPKVYVVEIISDLTELENVRHL